MKVIYTGSPAQVSPKDRAKLEAKIEKLSKVIERRGEKEVHVILSQVRHLHKAEITMNAFDHALVGAGSNGDLATAMSSAIEKLEKQVHKLRTKWRDTHRTPDGKISTAAPAEPPVRKSAPAKKATPKQAASPKPAKTKVFRVDHKDGRKPMSLEEAMLEMAGQEYLVYRDAKTDRVCTLLRRPDGHLDLIES